MVSDRAPVTEYKSFYDVLRPGIATSQSGTPEVSEQAYRQRMDRNSDVNVSREEMAGTPVLTPAETVG